MKPRRIFVYLLGLFIMTIGISLSVKSNLGVSPVSSIPYTMTLVWGIEMGKATILMHVFLVALQVVILRKDFKLISLMQVVVSVAFGYFTTFSNYMMSFMPTPENYVIRLVYLGISVVCVALGILLYLTANIMPLAGEGVMGAVAFKTGKPFPKVKVGFDVSMVVISLVTCLIAIQSLGSVREGTIIAAVMVGVMVGVFTKCFKERLEVFLNPELASNNEEAIPEEASNVVLDGISYVENLVEADTMDCVEEKTEVDLIGYVKDKVEADLIGCVEKVVEIAE